MLSKSSLATGLLLAFSTVAYASTSIGTVSAPGSIRVDGYAIPGNATLFDGTAIQTSEAMATVRLRGGAEVKLAPGSQGTLYRDHIVLQEGRGEISANDSFQLEAAGLRVASNGGNARGVVAMVGLGTIQVTAMVGELQVTTGTGQVLGKVLAGKSMSFALQNGGGGGGKGGGWTKTDIIITGVSLALAGTAIGYAISNNTGSSASR